MRAPRKCPGRVTTVVTLIGALAAGCGYSIRPPYDANVRTVYVPVFKSNSFRRDLNFMLTRRIQEEIQNRTPFKVVGSPEGADTTLEGTITFVDKNVQVENPSNLPRQIMGTIMVQVRWVDNRLPFEEKRDLKPVTVVETVPFYPEIGEPVTLGWEKAIDKLARQVIGMMEERW
jgi:hypothetical protein